MKNIFLLLFVTIFLSVNLVGCTGGSYSITIGGIDATKNNMSGEYQSFSGYYFKEVYLEKGKELTLGFLAETEKGNLVAKVIDSEGKIVKTLNPDDTANVIQSGEYKLQVEGEKHQGNFTLSWKIK